MDGPGCVGDTVQFMTIEIALKGDVKLHAVLGDKIR